MIISHAIRKTKAKLFKCAHFDMEITLIKIYRANSMSICHKMRMKNSKHFTDLFECELVEFQNRCIFGVEIVVLAIFFLRHNRSVQVIDLLIANLTFQEMNQFEKLPD